MNFLHLLPLVAALMSAPAGDTVSVSVPVEHQWLYESKSNSRLDVLLDANQPGARVSVTVDLVTDLSLMSPVKDTVASVTKTFKAGKKQKKLSFNLGKLQPGFYQVNLSVKGAEAKYAPFRVFNIGVSPEQIVSPQDKPEDFDSFWASTLEELAAVPMDPEFTLVPGHSNGLRTTYTVKMKSLGGATIGGILCVPNKPGKYTTYIDYMGYGANPDWYDPSADPDAVEFRLSVRDQGIFKFKNRNWMHRGLDSKENFYYRGAFCDVIRAIDFVCRLEPVDTNYIFARGESQGGAFTLVSVSLDHRIKACAPAVPFLNDYPDYDRIVPWPLNGVKEQARKQGISEEQLFDMLRYFDIKNFTDRIKCPVFMSFGLQDATCPPHTNFAGYNIITSDKHWYCSPLAGHNQWAEKEWHKARAEWFEPMEKQQ